MTDAELIEAVNQLSLRIVAMKPRDIIRLENLLKALTYEQRPTYRRRMAEEFAEVALKEQLKLN